MAMLEVQGLMKSFGGLMAIHHLNLAIGEGEIVGLIGPNGAGKTTLFNLVSGFLRPDSGKIIFKGENITGLKPHVVCKKGIARTFQIVKPFPKLTTFRNIRIGAYHRSSSSRKIIDKRVEEILNFLGLAEKKKMLGSDLTIADRKNLELGRALATGPQLLLLDEIMGGLNPVEQEKMVNIVQRLNQEGITLLVIEHNMRVIMSLSQRIVVLNYGEKIAEGSPEEVARNQNVIKVYLGDQGNVRD
jgi:branched-chain amino acid transport system ATP-binding protein